MLLMLRCTLGWGGGDVNVLCNLLTLLMLRHAGVGGDVNVPCNLRVNRPSDRCCLICIHRHILVAWLLIKHLNSPA